MAVVVLDIEVQDVKKLPSAGDQEVVQALPQGGDAERVAELVGGLGHPRRRPGVLGWGGGDH